MRSSKPTLRINQDITESEVRLVDAKGNQVGIVSIDEALDNAKQASMDLVEISPNSEPPVCRVMDYGKFAFDQHKKKGAAKKKQKKTQVKEIKMRPVTEEGDYQVKLRNLIRFLKGGDKTKVTIRFRGREMAHRELGLKVLDRVREDLLDYGVVEAEPKLEGRQLMMVLAPKKVS